MDTKAVSPLLGFVLLMAIVMGFIGILQSTAVPQWNKATEVKHLDSLKYEVADIGKAISISASTGSPAKVVLNAGVDYPNYYVLFSPSKASTTISAVNLSVNVSGSLSINEQTSAIIVEPNYLYSPRLKMIYEHSAVLREELNGLILAESSQSAFSSNSIHLSIIKANFGSFATTETASIILFPESFGGSNIFSGSIEFECYDENTANWWNRTLSSIYGQNNVSVSGRTVIINLQNVYLSISVFSAYALHGGDVSVPPSPRTARLIPVSPTSYNVFQGSTVTLIAKVVDDYGNPIRNSVVTILDPCNAQETRTSDENGLVWYYFNAGCNGLQTVTFSTDGNNLDFNILVEAFSGGGGGGGTLDIRWFKDSSYLTDYNWNVSEIGNQTDFQIKVMFEGIPASNVPVYFLLNNSTIVSINNKSVATNQSGEGFVNLTANMNGNVAIAAFVFDSSARLNITITGVGQLNLPPSQPSIQTDNRYYRVGETITATASGSSDPDGDPITYYYKFYDLTVSTTLQDWSTTNTYAVQNSEEGHRIRVYAKACDDKNACSAEVYTDVGVIKVIEIRNVTFINDSYVRSGLPNRNYGTSATIYSGYTNANTWRIQRIFIKFDLPADLLDKRIINATLYLYKTGHTGSPTSIQLGAHRVTAAWSETTITWNNQPSFESSATSSITPPNNNIYLAWNVTSDVQLFADGAQNNGWCIKSSNEAQNTRVNFASKESNVNKPYLRIEFAPRVD